MDWRFPWVSSLGSDFRYDFGAAFTEEEQRSGAEYNFRHQDTVEPQREGMSVFLKDDSGSIFHTYSAYARGIDLMNTAYNYLDTVPKGRDENGRSQYWVRRHDEYGE